MAKKDIEKAIKEILENKNQISEEGIKKVLDWLENTRKTVAAEIVGAERFDAFFLPRIKAAIEKAIIDFARKAQIDIGQTQDDMFDVAKDAVNNILSAATIRVGFPQVSMKLLDQLKGFAADKITGISLDLQKQIENELTLGMLGGKTPFEVMQRVSGKLPEASVFGKIEVRAESIVRTESNRVFSMSSHEEVKEAGNVVPGLKKQWLWGGSLHPRPSHIASDGQVQDIDEFFNIGGALLMFPHDPNAPASEVVNCRCTSVPYMEGWE